MGKLTGSGKLYAEEYIRLGLLAKGRKILIVNAAVGGTGFKRKHWGRGEILSERLYEMLELATSEPQNKMIAFLWHQGEHDVFENLGVPQEELYARYKTSLKEFFQTVRVRYGDVPVIAAGFSEQYRTQNEEYRKGCDTVSRVTREVFSAIGNAAFIETQDLRSNDQVSGNGDIVHFCRESLYELGHRYFEKFLALQEKKE